MLEQEILPKPEWLYARCVRLTVTSDKQIATYVPASQRHSIQGKQLLRKMRLHLIDQGVTILADTELRASLSQAEVAVLDKEVSTQRCFHMIIHGLIIKGGHPPSKLATVYRLDEDTIRAYVGDIDKNALPSPTLPLPDESSPSIVHVSPKRPSPIARPSPPPTQTLTSPILQPAITAHRLPYRPLVVADSSDRDGTFESPTVTEVVASNGHDRFQVQKKVPCASNNDTTTIMASVGLAMMALFCPHEVRPKKK